MDLTELVEGLRKRIGLESRPHVKTIEKGALLKFCTAIGETNPLYTDEEYARTTRYGGLIAPPTYVSVFPPEVISAVIERDLPLKRFLHTDDIVQNFRPIYAGDVITAVARFADVYVKTGRLGPMLFQAADIILTNQNDERVAIVRVVTTNFE
jgi:acyl dehydratase